MGETENNAMTSARWGLRRMFATALLAILGVLWFVWGPIGPIFYLGGLFNSMSFYALLLAAFLLLVLFASVFARALLAYAFAPWCRPSRHRKTILPLVVIAGLVGPPLVGLIGLTPSPFDMFVRGFARYAQRRVDIEAVRSWLDSLNPKDYIDEYGTAEKRFFGSEQPACIATLHPKWATVRRDESKHLTVQLLWGEGPIGHWGVLVGPRDMPTTPLNPSAFPKPRFPLAPGAYIWSSD
jgi:hypothetical protein